MKIPTITGIIRRRILLNYRVDPEVVAAVLPPDFRPKLTSGFAIAGICLIRLEQIRPLGLPALTGVSSENSAHRIAAEWDTEDGPREGVYIPRRDTDSRLNALAGGRIFPGVHHHSRFEVRDSGGKISLRVTADDPDAPLVELEAQETAAFPPDSIFGNLEASSRFFETGCIGYSACPGSPMLDGLRLATERWKVAPLHVNSVHSAYYGNRTIFPADSIEFDHALIMRDIPHQWHSEPQILAGEPAANCG